MNGDKFLEMIGNIDADLIEESYATENAEAGEAIYRRKCKVRKAILLVTAVVLTFGVVTTAAIRNEWDIDIVNYMGISEADTVQLSNGIVQIDAKDTKEVKNELTGEKEDVTFHAVSSIGDKNNAYIKIVTDISIPEEFNDENDYFLPEIWDVTFDGDIIKDWSGSLESMVEDGKVCFMMAIHDADGINKSAISLTLGNIYLYHDKGVNDESFVEPGELMYEETWNLNWKYEYKSNARTCRVNADVVLHEAPCHINRIEITPLEIKIIGTVKASDKPNEFCGIDEIESVTLKDGSVILIDGGASGGGCGNTGIYICLRYYRISGYVDIYELRQVLEPDEVAGVRVAGVDIIF